MHQSKKLKKKRETKKLIEQAIDKKRGTTMTKVDTLNVIYMYLKYIFFVITYKIKRLYSC